MSSGTLTKEVAPSVKLWQFACLFVLVAAGLLFTMGLGDRSLISEEVRWAQVAREMRASGDYLNPTINGRPYFDKPVGSYWLIVGCSYFTGGVTEFSARLPTAIAGVLGVWIVMLLGRRLFDWRTAFIAGAVLATSFGFAFYARRATADVETVTGTLITIWWFLRNEHRPTGPWVLGLWLWCAVVSLAKGLLGFALPMVVFFFYGLSSAWAIRASLGSTTAKLRSIVEQNRWFFQRWTLLAIPLAVLVYFLPFLLAASQNHDTVGLSMVWRENVQRFVAPHNHVGPVYLYCGVIFVLAAPWSIFLPAALLPRSVGNTTRGDRFAGAYFWAVFLFFTAAASRRSYYLLPVLPASALLLARVFTAQLHELTRLAKALRSLAWWLYCIGVVLAGILLLPAFFYLPKPFDVLPPLPQRGWYATGWGMSVVAVLAMILKPKLPRFEIAIIIVFAAFYYGFGVVYPLADDLGSRQDFLKDVRSLSQDEPRRLALYHATDTIFELGQQRPDYITPHELTEGITKERIRWVLMPKRLLSGLNLDGKVLYEETVLPWESPERVGSKLILFSITPR